MRLSMSVFLAFAAMLAVACGGADVSACPEGTEPFVQYELFMGRSGDAGEVVDDAAWDAFLGETVTPRFPDGLTVLDAHGQWRGSWRAAPEGTLQGARGPRTAGRRRCAPA